MKAHNKLGGYLCFSSAEKKQSSLQEKFIEGESSCSAGRPRLLLLLLLFAGEGRSEGVSSLPLFLFWRDGTARRWSGTGRPVCRYDGLRSEARGSAAAGGSAADCRRHHHRAPLHHCSQLGKTRSKRFGRAVTFTHRRAARTAELSAAFRKPACVLTLNTPT